jgi:hypothetical protein
MFISVGPPLLWAELMRRTDFTASLSVELNRVILESHIEKESSAYLNLQNS